MGGFDLSDLLWPDVSQGRQPQHVAPIDTGSSLSRGLVHAWALNVSGNTLTDNVGNAHGVLNTGNSWSRDTAGYYLYALYQATLGNDSIAVGDSSGSAFPKTDDFTYSFFVRYSTIGSGKSLELFGGPSGGNGALNIRLDNTGQLQFIKQGQVLIGGSSTYVSANTWTHCAVVRTATNVKFYLDGNLSNTVTTTQNPNRNVQGYLFSGFESNYNAAELRAPLVFESAKSAAEILALRDNSWQVFKVPVDVPFVIPSAGGGATALAGNAQAIASASGALSVSTPVALAGAAVGVVTSTGAVSSAMPISGAAAAVAAASGNLGSGILLAGGAQAQAGASGNITFGFSISGAALATAVASGVLGTQKPLAGGAQAAVAATGNLQVSTASSLAGNAQAAAAATGQMQVQLSISGAALMEALASGSITVTGSTALAGNAPVVATAYGDATIAIPLAGAAQIVASSTGDLHNGKPLAGSSVAVSAASGLITVTASLSGDGVAQAIASGFMALQIPLSGAALMQALAMGSLGTGADLQPGSDRYRVYYPAKTRRVIMPS